MWKWQLKLVIGVLAASCGSSLRAELTSEAVLCFPVQTEYVEYDNLAMLRTLADYNTLRQRFSGKPLEDAKAALARLGIQESQVHEVVTGSSVNGLYGVVAGTFSGAAAASSARRKGLGTKVEDSEAFCPASGTCIAFLEDSLAAFGSIGQLKEMLQARLGIVARLSSKRDVVALLTATERNAPVRGLVYGGQLRGEVADMLNDWTGWNRDWSTFSAHVSAIGFGVRFDSKTHVSATLECTSAATAGLLRQMLSLLGGMSGGSAPFQNLQVASSGNSVDFKVDTALPGAAAK